MERETSSASSHVFKLPELYLGCYRIRYLFLTPDGKVLVPTNENLACYDGTSYSILQQQTSMMGVPMFLGSDVLAGIPQLLKNRPRVHSRYSNQGLATKLLLSDHRIEDITNGRQVWFYSVQGLFQAVFEYHSQPIKRYCLLGLQRLWLERFEDGPLAAETRVKHVTHFDPAALRAEGDLANSDSAHTYSHGTRQLDDGPGSEQPSGEKSMCQVDIVSSCFNNDASTRVIQQGEDSDVDPRRSAFDQNNVPQSCGICSKERGSDLTNRDKILPFWQLNSNNPEKIDERVRRELEIILKKICETVEILGNVRTACTERLQCVKEILRFCVLQIYTQDCVDAMSLIISVIKSYSDILSGNATVCLTDFDNNFGIQPQKHAVLCLLSESLGKEFSKLEHKIMNQVDIFKQSHIGQIGSLPAPQSMVQQLFPACMSCLLENWMGIHKTRYIHEEFSQSNNISQSELSDHNYIQQVPEADPPLDEVEKVLCAKVYPFIQLILEFANNCLISGVAHVLYTRLRDGIL